MKSTWQKISDIGIDESVNDELKKRLKVTNQIAATLSLIAACYLFIFYALGYTREAAGVVFIVGSISATIVFNYYGIHSVSRIWLLTSLNAAVLIYAYIFGRNAGIHNAYFSFVCIPWIIYDIKQWRQILIGVLMSAGCYLLYIFSDGEPIIGIDEKAQRTISVTLGIAVFLIITLSLMFFAYQSYKAEHYLKESNMALRAQDEALNQQNRQLKEIAWIQSHKMRKPVATILGLIGVLNPDKPVVDPENKKTIEYIKTAGTELDSVIAEIDSKTRAVSG